MAQGGTCRLYVDGAEDAVGELPAVRYPARKAEKAVATEVIACAMICNRDASHIQRRIVLSMV